MWRAKTQDKKRLFFSYVKVLYPLATQVTADPKEN
jgi:hypothetical protein